MKNLQSRKGLRYWVFGTIVLLIAALAVFLLQKPSLDFDPMVGRAILPPVKIPQFNLVDYKGIPFDKKRLNGHWTLATIGYTYCPDVCPTTLLQMANFYKQLEKMPDEVIAPQFVFLSVDPFRDTPEELGKYVEYFHKEFIGVTGKPQDIHQLVTALGLYYVYIDPDDNQFLDNFLEKPQVEGYEVTHSSSVLIISPQAELVAIMSPPFLPHNVIAFLKKLQRYYGD